MVLWSGRSRRHKLSKRDFHCANCQKKRTIRFYLVKRVFGLFFVPIFPMGIEVTMNCTSCGTGWDISQAPVDHTYISFALLAVLIIGMGAASIIFVPYCLGVAVAIFMLFIVNYAYLGHVPSHFKGFPDPEMVWQGDGEEPKDPKIIRTVSYDYEPRHDRK